MMVGRGSVVRRRAQGPAVGRTGPGGPEPQQCSTIAALPALKGVSLTVAAGEILGIGGVAGNGQEELAEAITGLRPQTGGMIRLDGREMTGARARDYIEAGVAYVPADRNGVASVGNLSLSENVVLKQYREGRFANGPFLNFDLIDGFADELINRYNIAAPGHEVAVRLLSGGNLQEGDPGAGDLLSPQAPGGHVPDPGDSMSERPISSEKPSTSIARKGRAILLVSEDLEELFSLSDRIGVLFSGEIMGILPIIDADVETVGLMMAGAKRFTDETPVGSQGSSDSAPEEAH